MTPSESPSPPHPSKTSSEGSVRPWKLLKRNRKESQSLRWGQSRFDLPPHSLVSSLSAPLDVILFTQFVQETTEGEAREEVCSRVNDLVFISNALTYGRTDKLGKVSCDSKIQKVCLGWRGVEHGSAWLFAVAVFDHLLSHVRLFSNRWTAAHQASLSFTISWSLLKLMCRWCYLTISSSAALFSSKLVTIQFC